jgi:hypothetical protein
VPLAAIQCYIHDALGTSESRGHVWDHMAIVGDEAVPPLGITGPFGASWASCAPGFLLGRSRPLLGHAWATLESSWSLLSLAAELARRQRSRRVAPPRPCLDPHGYRAPRALLAARQGASHRLLPRSPGPTSKRQPRSATWHRPHSCQSLQLSLESQTLMATRHRRAVQT